MPNRFNLIDPLPPAIGRCHISRVWWMFFLSVSITHCILGIFESRSNFAHVTTDAVSAVPGKLNVVTMLGGSVTE